MGNSLTESAGVYKLSPRTADFFVLLQFSIGKNKSYFFDSEDYIPFEMYLWYC